MVSRFYHFISSKAMLALLLFVGAIGSAFAEVKVQVDNISIASGQTVTVPVILESDEVIRDLQLDLKATNGYTISNIQKQGLPNHGLASNVLSSTGATRVMITSNSAATISTGTRTLLTVDVTSNTSAKGTLSVSNIVVSFDNSSVAMPANVTAQLSPIPDTANLSVTNTSVESGESFSIPVRLKNNFAVRDIQMDIYVPSAISNVRISQAISSHTLEYEKLDSTDFRVVIASADGNSIAANDSTILFYLNGTAPSGISGNYIIEFFDVISSKSNTETVDGNNATVTLKVTKKQIVDDPNDFTYFIKNPGFDEDMTFLSDGSIKDQETDKSGSLSSRSHKWVAADGTIYAASKTSEEGNGSWRRTDTDYAFNGFLGQIKGWELSTGSTGEWTYFGAVPYTLNSGSTTVGIADDNNNSWLTVAGKPEDANTEGNSATLYLRAGWTNYAEYTQVVSLPCAQYRLEYWVNNMNYASTDASGLENRCEIICRKDHFKDEAGINANGWEKHTIEFTPTAEFTIKMGFKAGNYGSGKNPILLIDGLKLTKIGEADKETLLASDLNDLADQLYTIAEEDFSDAYYIQDEIAEAIDTIYEVISDGDVNAMQACYNKKSAYLLTLNNASVKLQTLYNKLYEAWDLLESTEDAGYDEFLNTVEETQEYIDNGCPSPVTYMTAVEYVDSALNKLTTAIDKYTQQSSEVIVAQPRFNISNGESIMEGPTPSFYVHFNDIRNIDPYTDAIVYAELYKDSTLVSTASTWNYLTGYHYFYFNDIDSIFAGNYTLKVTKIELIDYNDSLNVDYSVYFNVIEPYKLNIELAEGWNWISVNAPTSVGLWDITYQTEEQVDYVANQIDDASYSYNNQDWYGNLWDLDSDNAYKVHAKGDCAFLVTYPSNGWWSEVRLNPGWNWISYQVAYPQMVSEALAYYDPTDGDIIKTLDNSAVYSSEEGWIGDFVMNPGEGYLYKSESDYSNYLEYYWGEEAAVSARKRVAAQGYTTLSYNPHLYRDNMTVIAAVKDDTYSNFCVAAMSGNDCRGISKSASGIQLVTVHGEKRGEEISFYLIDQISGAVYAANETVNFNGASEGTLASPVVLTAGALVGDIATGITGAPAASATDDVYTIQGVKVNGINAKGIYIKNGEKVIVK